MTVPKNGAAALPQNGKTQVQPSQTKAVLAAKPETPIVPFSKDGELKPLEDRLHRLNLLFDLQRKYNKLQDSKLKLSAFTVKADGETSSLTIRDDQRNDFTTYNPEIIQEVVKFINERIQAKTKEIEPLLTW